MMISREVRSGSLTKARPVCAYVYVWLSLTQAPTTEDGSHGDAETSCLQKKNLYCRLTARTFSGQWAAWLLVARYRHVLGQGRAARGGAGRSGAERGGAGRGGAG